jgi:hypothetical protein
MRSEFSKIFLASLKLAEDLQLKRAMTAEIL